jgi:hypothetical protein
MGEGGRRGRAGGEGGTGLRHRVNMSTTHGRECPDLKAHTALGAQSSQIEFRKIKDEERKSETDHKIYPFPFPRHLISILSPPPRHPVPSYRATLRIHASTCTCNPMGTASLQGDKFSHHPDTAIVFCISNVGTIHPLLGNKFLLKRDSMSKQ